MDPHAHHHFPHDAGHDGHDGLLASVKTLTFWTVVGFLLYWCARRAPKTTGFVVGLLTGLWLLTGALTKSPWGA